MSRLLNILGWSLFAFAGASLVAAMELVVWTSPNVTTAGALALTAVVAAIVGLVAWLVSAGINS